jgi:hypothetical protein
MRADDVLKEVLQDPNATALLGITPDMAVKASMGKSSSNEDIEVIKAVINGSFYGKTHSQIFNEVKKIKGI